MKPNTLKRVWKEVKEVNADFFNLRTVISPDAIGDDASKFYFVMLPNDGAMAHLALVGTVGIAEVSVVYGRVLDWLFILVLMSCSRTLKILRWSSSTLRRNGTTSMYSELFLTATSSAAPCASISFAHKLMEGAGSPSTRCPVSSHR